MSIAEDCKAAAHYLRLYGWRQHAFGEPGEPCCLLGALRVVCGYPHAPEPIRYEFARRDIRKRIKEPVATWNDRPRRRLHQVLALLESMGREHRN